MDFAPNFSFGFDDHMTKETSGKAAEEKNRVKEHVPLPVVPQEQSDAKLKKALFAKRSTEAMEHWKATTHQKQGVLASALGVVTSTISVWKKDGIERASADDTVVKFADFLGVDLESLWSEKLVRLHPPKRVEQTRRERMSYTEKASLLLEGPDSKYFKWLIDSLIKKKN